MRAVRALRPLRTINRLPGLKRQAAVISIPLLVPLLLVLTPLLLSIEPFIRRLAQVDTLLLSLPHLADVGGLSAFIMVVFGVLGLQLFQVISGNEGIVDTCMLTGHLFQPALLVLQRSS